MGKGEKSNGDLEAVGYKFPLSFWEAATTFTVLLSFVLLCVYLIPNLTRVGLQLPQAPSFS